MTIAQVLRGAAGLCVAFIIAYAVVANPLVGLGLAAVGLLGAVLRSVPGLALVLLLGGPVLGSRFQVGPLTVDNWLSLVGVFLAVGWSVLQRRVPFVRASALPLTFAVAVLISGVANDVLSVPSLVRFTGIACIPGLLLQPKGVSAKRARLIALGLLTVGAATVVLQPVLSIIPPYVDPDTGLLRYGGLFGHPNFAACTLSLGILFVVANPSRWWISGLQLLLLGSAVLVTGSLGAIGTLVACLVVLLARSASRLLTAIVVSLGLVAASGATLLTRLSAFGAPGDDRNSLQWRFQRWSDAIGLVRWPNIFGLGWGQVEVLLGGPAHSAYVAMVVELGFFGLMVVACGLAVTLMASRGERLTVVFLAFALASSLTDPILFYPSTFATWVYFIALRARPTQLPLAIDSTNPSRSVGYRAFGHAPCGAAPPEGASF